MMAIWIKTPPDAEPVWMAADNRIRELALSIERRAGIAPDADGLRQIREWDDEPIEQCKRCIACASFDWDAEKKRLSL